MRKTTIFLVALLAVFGCKDKTPTGDQLDPGDQGTELWEFSPEEIPETQDCTDNQIAAILENTEDARLINCNFVGNSSQVVTRRLLFQGSHSSGVTFDCGGGTIGRNNNSSNVIIVRSDPNNWEPIHDVTIKNCNINGSIRIYGKGPNAGSDIYYEPSRTIEYVSDTRNSSPYYITLDNIEIKNDQHVLVYFGPGTHHNTLMNSVLHGNVHASIYLGAESFGNEIDNNILTGSGRIYGREAIAVDASESNTISNNEFSNVWGGVFLYRNCGENGTIRHTTPSNNKIVNNNIHSHVISLNAVGIFLGSRDGGKGYCDEDKGYPYGSSISDQDHARFNTVTGNQLWDCSIETGNKTNRSNTVRNNIIH